MVFRYLYTPHPMYRLRDDLDRLLTGFLGHWPADQLAGARRGQPAVNVWEQDDTLLAEMEVPGLTSDQVDISVVGDELSLKVDRPEPKQEGVTYHRRERPTGSFTRVLRLPVEIDAGRVEAELRDGVLTVTLPKAESARPRKIEVTSA